MMAGSEIKGEQHQSADAPETLLDMTIFEQNHLPASRVRFCLSLRCDWYNSGVCLFKPSTVNPHRGEQGEDECQVILHGLR